MEMNKYLSLILLFSAPIFAAQHGTPKQLTEQEQAKLNLALYDAIDHQEDANKIRSLLEARANHTGFSHPLYGWQHYLLAASRKSKAYDYVPLLLEHQKRIDPEKLEEYVNAQGAHAECALLHACDAYKIDSDRHLSVVQMLLDAKASPNYYLYADLLAGELSTNKPRITPLIALLDYPHYKWRNPTDPRFFILMNLLLQHPNTNVNQPDHNYHEDYSRKITVRCGDRSIKMFPRTMHNKTPLMYIAQAADNYTDRRLNPYDGLLELFVKQGADPALKDHQGNMAINYIPIPTQSTCHIRELLKGKMHHPTIAQATGLHPNLVKIIAGYITGFDSFEETNTKKIE